jgi:hypothetical protein
MLGNLYRLLTGSKYMSLIKIIAIMVVGLAVTYSVVTYAANKKVERQQYRLVKSVDDIDIRFYPRAVMATVTSAGNSYMGNSNNHFRTLAGYIFGGNKSSQKIAMTAPVHMERHSTETRMSFVMPSQYDMDKLPVPDDNSVDLHYSQEGYYAVLKFGGFANEQKIDNKIAELKTELATLGYKTLGAYSYLGYNAPWDVVGRENEIIVQIEYSE